MAQKKVLKKENASELREIETEKSISNHIMLNNSILQGRIVVVKVGSNESPAKPEDIKEMEEKWKDLLENVECKLFVTHHSVNIEVL